MYVFIKRSLEDNWDGFVLDFGAVIFKDGKEYFRIKGVNDNVEILFVDGVFDPSCKFSHFDRMLDHKDYSDLRYIYERGNVLNFSLDKEAILY